RTGERTTGSARPLLARAAPVRLASRERYTYIREAQRGGRPTGRKSRGTRYGVRRWHGAATPCAGRRQHGGPATTGGGGDRCHLRRAYPAIAGRAPPAGRSVLVA